MSMLQDDDLGHRLRVMEFTLGQSFYGRGHLGDVLKKFAIANSFEVEKIKKGSIKGSWLDVGPKITCDVCSIDRGAQSFKIRKFCDKHTCNI